LKEFTRTVKLEGNRLSFTEEVDDGTEDEGVPDIYIGQRTEGRVTQSCIPKISSYAGVNRLLEIGDKTMK
jgi:hypothetical protein